MKRTALILAGAVAFDLGVMAVAAQAQQQTQAPPVRTPTTTTGPTFPGPDAAAAPVWDENGTTDCTNGGRPGTAGRPTSCGPAAIRTQVTQLRVQYLKIEGVNTIQACRARQGEVVMHEGARQCRLAVPEAPGVGNPTLPRPIPPR